MLLTFVLLKLVKANTILNILLQEDT